ncbi:MAG: hypothetical protein HYX41_06025 [Bdellovibrio sp.]|nr:hypothetical protein [Bdellovibrio sp.]
MFSNSFDPTKLDPSKLDPQTLMKLSQLVQSLPPDKLSRMQTLMHNMMAGFDVRKEMEEFEKTLPAGFREQLMGAFAAGQSPQKDIEVEPVTETNAEMSLREARLTLLRGVAQGTLSPEEAETLLFPKT